MPAIRKQFGSSVRSEDPRSSYKKSRTAILYLGLTRPAQSQYSRLVTAVAT